MQSVESVFSRNKLLLEKYKYQRYYRRLASDDSSSSDDKFSISLVQSSKVQSSVCLSFDAKPLADSKLAMIDSLATKLDEENEGDGDGSDSGDEEADYNPAKTGYNRRIVQSIVLL